MLRFNISYGDLIKFPYFVDTIERRIGLAKAGDFTNNFL
jgi:hypothetical protein